MRTLLLAALALAALLTAPVAQADPPCAAYDVCQYEPTPQNNGPLTPPAWGDVPGTYGGWTNLPVLCDPITDQCRQVAPAN